MPHPSESLTSDDVLIKTILAENKLRCGTNFTDGDAFECFCAEAVLKSLALTFDDVDNTNGLHK